MKNHDSGRNACGKWTALALVTAGYALLQGIRGVPGAVMPGIKSEYANAPDGAWGAVMGAFAVTYGVAVLFGGVAGDLLGHRRILKFSALLFSLACAACGFAGWWGTDPAAFLTIAFGVAFALGQSLYPASAAGLVSLMHDKTRATALSVMQGAYYLAAVLVAWGAGWMAGVGALGWRLPFWILGGAGLAVAAALAAFLRGDGGAAPGGAAARPRAVEAFGAFARCPTAWLLTIAFGCMTFANLGFAMWSPLAVKERFLGAAAVGSNLAGAAAFHAMLWHYLGCGVGIAAASWASDRLAARTALARPAMNLAGLAVAALGLWRAFGAASLAECAAWLVVFGVGRGAYDSNMCAALFEVVPARFRAAATGFMCFGAFLTGCAGPKILGALRDGGVDFARGLSVMGAAPLAGAAAIAAAMFFTFRRDAQRAAQ